MAYSLTDKAELDKYDVAILEEITKNPFVSHNELKRRLGNERHIMATRTFDHHIQRLVKDERIMVKPQGNKKLYRLNTPIEKSKMIESTIEFVCLTEMTIGLFEKKYSKIDLKTKTGMLLSYVNQLTGNVGLMALLPCVTLDPKDRQLSLELIARFQDCLFRLFTLVLKDPDMKAIATVLFSKLSGMQQIKDTPSVEMLKHAEQTSTQS